MSIDIKTEGELDERYRLVITKQHRDKLHLKARDEVIIESDGEEIRIRKKEDLSK